jgi:hypothetical protein
VVIEAEFEEIEESGTPRESELDLTDDDSLPWLEAGEDDGNSGGVATGQVIGFAALLLALLAVVIGSIWYFANRPASADLVADGSTIEAPEGPYKERPEDPGGKEFEGTGNVAPVVGEGGTREGVMATDDTPALPPTVTPSPAATPASAKGGIGVQLAAYSSRTRAEQGWNEISGRTDALDGVRYRIEEGVVDIGKVYRLQAVAGDRAAADRLCAALKADGLDCQVKP